MLMSFVMSEARGGTADPTRARANGPLTLEAAYDRALANDESIGIAYQTLRNAGLQPLRALTRPHAATDRLGQRWARPDRQRQ